MKQKVIKICILLLLLPIMISLFIAITTDNNEKKNYDSNQLNSSDIVIDQISNNSTYIYFSVFLLVIGTSGIWIYVKKKAGF